MRVEVVHDQSRPDLDQDEDVNSIDREFVTFETVIRLDLPTTRAYSGPDLRQFGVRCSGVGDKGVNRQGRGGC